MAGLAAPVLLDDHLHVQPHQRAHIGGEHAVAARHQHRVHATGQADHHLLHARVGSAQELVQAAQHLDLEVVAHAVHRVQRRIQRAPVAAQQRLRRLRAAVAGNGPRRLRRGQQRIAVDVVGIGETGLLAGNRAYAHALLDGVGAVLDDAVLHAPALAPRMLEIQVAKVDAGAEQCAEGALQAGGIEAGRKQQAGFGEAEGVFGHGTQHGGRGRSAQAPAARRRRRFRDFWTPPAAPADATIRARSLPPWAPSTGR